MISLSHRCAGHQFRRQGYGCGGLAVHDLQEEGNHFGTDSCEALSSRWVADRTTWRRAESSDPPTAGVSAFNHPVMGDQPGPNLIRIEHLPVCAQQSLSGISTKRPFGFRLNGAAALKNTCDWPSSMCRAADRTDIKISTTP